MVYSCLLECNVQLLGDVLVWDGMGDGSCRGTGCGSHLCVAPWTSNEDNMLFQIRLQTSGHKMYAIFPNGIGSSEVDIAIGIYHPARGILPLFFGYPILGWTLHLPNPMHTAL